LRTVNICVSKAVIVLKGNVPSKKKQKNIQYKINVLYKENKKDMGKYKYHKDVL